MRSLKEALVKKSQRLKRPVRSFDGFEEFDIFKTANGNYWCVMFDTQDMVRAGAKCLYGNSFPDGTAIRLDSRTRTGMEWLNLSDINSKTLKARGGQFPDYDVVEVYRNRKLDKLQFKEDLGLGICDEKNLEHLTETPAWNLLWKV